MVKYIKIISFINFYLIFKVFEILNIILKKGLKKIIYKNEYQFTYSGGNDKCKQ